VLAMLPGHIFHIYSLTFHQKRKRKQAQNICKYVTLLCDVQCFSGSNVDVDKFCFACIKTQTMLS